MPFVCSFPISWGTCCLSPSPVSSCLHNLCIYLSHDVNEACMALAAILAASVLLVLTGETKGNPSVKHFWRPALSCTLASPFGCKSVFMLTIVIQPMHMLTSLQMYFMYIRMYVCTAVGFMTVQPSNTIQYTVVHGCVYMYLPRRICDLGRNRST